MRICAIVVHTGRLTAIVVMDIHEIWDGILRIEKLKLYAWLVES